MLEIKGFIESSLIEWEGRIASVIFLPGCNLRCRYCHAGHLLEPDRLQTISREQVLDCMRRHRGWLDGAVITGGEPTLHGEELLDLIGAIKAIGLGVMVETNGTRPRWVERLVSEKWVDAIAMDVKAPLEPEAYRKVTGRDVEIEDLRSSIRSIINSAVPHEFRITVVPGMIGARELELIALELEGARSIALQNFRPDFCLDPSLRAVPPYTPGQMDSLGRIFSGRSAQVIVRGRDRGLVARSAQSSDD